MRKRNDDLTRAFNYSSVLYPPGLLVSCLNTASVEGLSANRAVLLIGLEINKSYCCCFLIGMVVISLMLGLVVALVSRRIDFGLATVAAIAGWIACFEGLLWWMCQ